MGARRSIDLITIDLGLPGMRKREGLRDLRVKYPEVRIVVVTASRDREMVLDALGAGVHGYIPKDFPVHEMADALRTVLAGQIYVPPFLSDLNVRKTSAADDDGVAHETALTGRQFQVLNLLAAGRSNKEIARLLCIAEGTVKVHIAAAFRMRSEEHTSELQSLMRISYAVFCLQKNNILTDHISVNMNNNNYNTPALE